MNEVAKTNMNNAVVRTPGLIAAEINSIKEQTKTIVIYNSIEIGRRLIEAKEIMPHGEWGNWLKEKVDYSQRTANNLMRIFQEYGADQISLLGDNLNSQAFANLSYSQAVALLGIPLEERENFIKENNVEDMSTRELQAAIKEKQMLQEQLKASEDKIKKVEADKDKFKKQIDDLKAKSKEDITNREVEIENLRMEIKKAQEKLSLAKENGNAEEAEELKKELDKNIKELKESNEKIEELKKQLEEKPIEVIAEIPEEVQKELQELREKAKHAYMNNLPSVKFKIKFEEIIRNFNDLLETLTEIEDKEANKKFKQAVLKVISDMQSKL